MRHHRGSEAQARSERARVRAAVELAAYALGLEKGDDMFENKKGTGKIVLARQFAMYLSHVVFSLSQDSVAHHFGRNRATVGNACQIVEDLRDDGEVDALLDDLENALRALPAPAQIAAPPMARGRR